MEVIFYFILFFGGMWLIGTIVSSISEANRKRREETKEQVVNEVLGGLNIRMVIEEYKRKLAHIRYQKVDTINEQIDGLKVQLWGKNAVLMNECPKCKGGHLIVRQGKFGKFMACTGYPKCDYTKNITKAREEYKKSISEQFVDDIKKAYS